MNRRTRAALAAAVLGGLLMGALAGCTGARAEVRPQQGPVPTGMLHGGLTIYAAASLTASFDDLASRFEKEHPGVTVRPIDYDGSSTLATQITEGAPADVFASADTATMRQVADHSLTDGAPTVFATNVLEIAVPPGDPAHITGLADLAKPRLRVVVCAPEVPCGAAARTLLTADGVHVTPASEEQNVTAVLTKVKAGEADAGLVYTTDVRAAAGTVDGVAIPDARKAVNRYPIAVLKGAANPAAAKAFVDYVTSPRGRKVLASYGFGAP